MNFNLRSDGTPAGTTGSAPTATAKPNPERRQIAGGELWFPQATGTAGVNVTERTALEMPAFLAAVTVLATDLAVLPLKTYQTQGTARREAREHRTAELFGRTPNGESTPVRWKQTVQGHAVEFGNGYAEIQRTQRNAPYQLHILDPEATHAKRDDSKRLYYETTGGKKVPAADVLHIAGLSYDGITGYNTVRLTKQAIAIGIAAAGGAADYYENGSEPGGYLKVPYRLEDQAAVDRLATGWEGRHGGFGRKHRLGVLEDGAEWAQTATDPDKSQALETRKFQVIEAIRALRVPPNKAGDMSEAHLSNLEASNLDYLTSALLGWLIAWEQECNLKLFTRAEWAAGYHVEHEVKALLRTDIKTRYLAYEIGLRNGFVSRNEVRADEGKNPIPAEDGGDKYTIQAQVVDLADAGIAFEPAAAADPTKGEPDDPKGPHASE